ncbi:MAG: LytTR family DNA-binding domain-containing protein [Clostridiales bacterium]|jgi:DNA-binding LytR/AlgR family response regulator|nr:LytTR family DNA-binding domain-containing protein [Clostridiales bacterium]
MRIAFCDDIQSERELLLGFAARYAAEHSLRIEPRPYSNAESLLGDFDADTMAAMFLDIYMDKINGVEAARIMRERGYAGAIVLCTASRDHFADGFVVDASHYLLKPVAYENFSEAMRRVLRVTGAAARAVSIQSGGNKLPVPVAGIQYAEVYNHETLLHLSGGTLAAGVSLSALEDMLGGDPFLRCYRSYIVNMDYVERIEGDAFVMKNGDRVLIARDGRKGVQSRYLAYVFSRMEGL